MYMNLKLMRKKNYCILFVKKLYVMLNKNILEIFI